MIDFRQKNEEAKARSAKKVAEWQEIGDIPAPLNLERRLRAAEDFPFFCATYFPAAFTLPWSEYHLKAARKIERAARTGGLFAFAMPRGSGKTTMCEWAAQWAILNGIISYVVLVGATEASAVKRLKNIKTSLQTNQLLREDYPEALVPIEKLERSVRRAEGQKHHGNPTSIGWTKKQVILPTVDITEKDWPDDMKGPAASSGAIIEVAGITGEIRGMNHMRDDGSIVRPQLAICDDPQTRESAKNPQQSDDRAATLAADVAYLAGPGKPIAVVVPCTVVYEGDLADRLLDRESEEYAEFQGERTAMLESFPSEAAMKLWDEYAEIRRDSFKADGDGSEATEFYRQNRSAMDEGAVVAWKERYDTGELSALQHAMNKYYRSETAFFAEYQNQPKKNAALETELTPDMILAKAVPPDRAEVPADHDYLTSFVDVQKDCLFWLIVAWQKNFTGHVVDYGTFPEQSRNYFALRDVRQKLSQVFPTMGLEAQLYAGLEQLSVDLFGRTFRRDKDGAEMRIDRMLVDANWGQSTETVYRFCRGSSFAIMPAHGRYVGASTAPFSEYKRKRGDRLGLNWMVPSVSGKRAIRHVKFDTNFWKSFVAARLAMAIGDRGSLTLFNANRSGTHRLLADHLTAEFKTRTEGRGREVDEWKLRPDRSDNHWLDCIVGAAVAASMEGCELKVSTSQGEVKPKRKRRRSVSYL